jgi:hypothetical protein
MKMNQYARNIIGPFEAMNEEDFEFYFTVLG